MADKLTRPKVGPADPETRRKKLQEVLNEPTRGTGVAPKATPEKPKRKKTLLDAVSEGVDMMDPTKPRKRRYGPKGKTEEEITGDE